MDTLSVESPSAVSVDRRLVLLIEEAAEQMQRGETVDLTDLVAAQPEYASALRELLPTIAALVGAGHGTGNSQTSLCGQIGKYQLLTKLGSGGMGTVYMARHTELDRVVALKVLARQRLADPQAVERFQREMRAIGRFDHPNIVRATDAGKEGQTHYLAMDYIDGLNLSSIVRAVGTLRVADACAIICEAATAIEYIHAHNLVHRDIKPSNIMLTKQGAIKILDLGLARLGDVQSSEHGELTGTGNLLGTIEYMAPEQCNDSRDVDGRADIYGLGATLYQLLTGRAPFAAENGSGRLKQLMATALDPVPSIRGVRPEVPQQLEETLMKMLAKDPSDRIAAASKVADRLREFSNESDLRGLVSAAILQAPADPLRDKSKITTSAAAISGTLAHGERAGMLRGSSVNSQALPNPTFASGSKPPDSRWRWPAIGAAAMGALVLSGVVLIIRDSNGVEKTRLPVDSSDRIEIASESNSPQAAKIDASPTVDESKKLVPMKPSGSCTLFAPNYGDKSSGALLDTLRKSNGIESVGSIESLAKLPLDDQGIVLVVLSSKDFEKIGSYNTEQLSHRKVIGIGCGAAKLFGELGLEINGGACAHGVVGEPRVAVVKNELIGTSTFKSPIFVFNPPILDPKTFHNDLFFGMYVGEKAAKKRERVEIIALQTADKNYAPIVRQGNHVLVCVDAPADQWSEDFQGLVREVAVALDSHKTAD